MYKIEVTKTAKKHIKKIAPRFHNNLLGKIQSVAKDPINNTDKVKDKTIIGSRKCRQGNYRIFFDIDSKKKILYVTAIKNRNKAYKSS